MGVCASCLGHDKESSESDETSRLIFDDPNALNYGAFGDQNINTVQSDPEDVQRETEALQKVVAETSSHLVDVFAIIPQTYGRQQSSIPGQDARFLQYRDILSRLASDDESLVTKTQDPPTPRSELDWASDGDDDDVEDTYEVVKVEGAGPLVGGFADV